MAANQKNNQQTGPGPSSINSEGERQLEDAASKTIVGSALRADTKMNQDNSETPNFELHEVSSVPYPVSGGRPSRPMRETMDGSPMRVDMKINQENSETTNFEHLGSWIKFKPSLPVDMKINQPQPPRASKQIAREHRSSRVQIHGDPKDLNLLKEAYLSLKAGDVWKDKFREDNANIFEQRSPLGNTVLHIAASYGNSEAVELVAQRHPELLDAINRNGDTALHVAARAKHIPTLHKLLAAYFQNQINMALFPESDKYGLFAIVDWSRVTRDFVEQIFGKILSFTFSTNKEGNTIFHEALISGDKRPVIFRVLEEPLIRDKEEDRFLSSLQDDFKKRVKAVASTKTNREDKSILYLAIEAGCKEYVERLLEHCPDGGPIAGKSPLLAAIMKRDIGILETILRKKPEWKHLSDDEQRAPIHYAASVGYPEGVCFLLEKCESCITERDIYGFSPLHLASAGGHVGVVDELLKKYPLDPTEIVDNDGRNILHIAAETGRLHTVNYILKRPELEKMINQKNWNGDTPLHLASLHFHPRIVHVLTWDKRLDLTLLNQRNETALDSIDKTEENPPFSKRLTWSALESAAAHRSPVKISTQGRPSSTEKKATNTDRFKDRIDTLLVVSTLIITATFAASLTTPGGNSSDSSRGIANMINRSMFHLFILSITISMYGAISVTVILIWCRLGDLNLMLAALGVASPLLGITLGTLSLSFLAGVYLVISKLSWPETTFLVISAVFVFMVVLLYALLLFPSESGSPVIRYISYYPFIALAKLTAKEGASGNRCGSDVLSAYT